MTQDRDKPKPGRGRIYGDIVEAIGDTPLVRVPKLTREFGLLGDLLLKLEHFNPLCSVKDRTAVGMLTALEQAGKIGPGSVLIEPTSGNTGIGLAFVAAQRGYRLILVMPETFSVERRKMLQFLGAEVILTPREPGISASIAKVKELLQEIPGSVWPSQFDNPANPAIHVETTAEEIWNDTGGAVDVIVSGIGTGGTFTGCARALKPRRPSLKMVAVEPEKSQALKGGTYQVHAIQGIGGGFVPDNLDTSLIDEVIAVSDEDALDTSRHIAKTEGIAVGISSGAAIWSGMQIAKRDEMAGKTIVAIVPSFAERYISTVLFDGY
ncbi:cysteine synthase A [Shimia biformata]|uniref:cysteine synthase A n=1 Tax=Shimia biformata TaxID=1294299 RepID=UPI0019506369|nr:cysteine synthase A [Shimia biformata]